MDFRLTEDQESIRELAAKFAKEVCAPEVETIEAEHRFPIETFRKFSEVGLYSVNFDEEYGGIGKDALAEVIVVEELTKASLSHAAAFQINRACAGLIDEVGSPEQKAKYLPWMIENGIPGSVCITESGAGSDAASMRTMAVRDGDDWILNGTKCFITGAGVSELYIVCAQTDRELGAKGITLFIVDPSTPGFSIGKIENKMGLVGSQTGEVILQDVRVPGENVLGEVGKGFKYVMANLDGARIGTAAQGLGTAEAALDLAIKYSKERVQFGRPISKFQGIQWYLAEMATKVDSAKWMIYHAAWLKNEGLPFSKEAAMAKLYGTTIGREVVNTALQIHGGYGYMKDYPLERMYRDVRITEIYEGTSEIQKVVIAGQLLR
ncbi:MAG: acyl-CoA dehydrogenase family protein [Oscillospiraceae bacterium]|nr:acyl-CoA dehydrogenase family protein [Oscillospiraceae bacterium]